MYNTSFEDGEYDPQKIPDGWFLLEDTFDYISWDNENPHTGSKSLKVQHPKDKINIILMPSQLMLIMYITHDYL